MKKKWFKDHRKVVLIVAAIAVVIGILFVAFSHKQESDPVLDPAPSAETTAPAKKASPSPKPSYPTKGKFEEDLLPRDEAEEVVTEGALSESAVGDLESKKYNSYSLEKDLQLAGPEQQQEVASREEVTDALTVSSSTPAPTSTPDSAVQQAAEAAASEQKQTADNAAADAQKAAAEAEAAAKAKAEAEAKAAADAAAKAEAEAAQAAAEAQQRAYEEAQAAAEAQQAAEAAAQAAKDQEVEAERQRICEASGGSYEHGACAYQQDDIEVISVESEAPAEASPAAE